jgi:hypothetical protein
MPLAYWKGPIVFNQIQANNAILHYFMVKLKTFLAEWWLFC